MDSTQVAFQIGPYVRVYKDGRVERHQEPIFIPPSPDATTGVSSKDTVYQPETNLSARLYLPENAKSDHKLPLLVYFHGGRFCIESATSPLYHPYISHIVSVANVVAVSVNYRLAPEDPLPAAYDDSWAALQWVGSHSKGDGPEEWLNQHVDFDRVFLGGDSAGANISHNLLIRAGQGEPAGLDVYGAVLIHPYFWGKEPIGSEDAHPHKIMADRAWPFVCPSSPGNDDPRVNPFAEEAPNLSDLRCKRVLICVAEQDILKDRGHLYCETLKNNGWEGEVEIYETPEAGHVFHLLTLTSEKASELINCIASFLKT